MTRFTTLLTATAIASLAAAPAAGAASAPRAVPGPATRIAVPRVHIQHMTLAVEITGLHQDRWHLQEDGYPDADRIWYAGKGAQTLGFSTPKPVTYQAIAMSGSIPGGTRLSPLSMTHIGSKPLRGSLRRRTQSWQYSDGNPCDREGGCEVNELIPPFTCPRRARKGGSASRRTWKPRRAPAAGSRCSRSPSRP